MENSGCAPRHGQTDDSTRAWADSPIVLWSVDPEDWKDHNAARIAAAVTEQVKDGDIILLHDIYHSSVDAAVQIVDELLRRGFCFVTVEDLLAWKGISPESGARLPLGKIKTPPPCLASGRAAELLAGGLFNRCVYRTCSPLPRRGRVLGGSRACWVSWMNRSPKWER